MDTTTVMGQSKLSIDNLVLMHPQTRLTDEMMAELEIFVRSPLPAPDACDDRHLAQCLRMMLAVLPKRSSDDLSGELFVAAYSRILREHPKAAISYMAKTAISECEWMPVPAKCLEIIGRWHRDDEHTKKRNAAAKALRDERRKREKDAEDSRLSLPAITQAEVDAMSPTLISMGLGCGALYKDEDGQVRPSPQTAIVDRRD